MADRFYCEETPRKPGCVKVLAIGNSFSDDTTTYLRNMAVADGVDLRVANLLIPGCSLQRHRDNLHNGSADYICAYHTLDCMYKVIPVGLPWALETAEWDYVTVQQVSGSSGKYDTFNPAAQELIAAIREKVPTAEIMLHMTWSYAQDYPGIAANGYASQEDMGERIKAAYAQFSADTDGARIIPSGEAIRMARTVLGDTLNRDGFHLNPKGRIITGYVWYEIFTGISALDSRFDPRSVCEGLTDDEVKAMRECAHAAVLAYQK